VGDLELLLLPRAVLKLVLFARARTAPARLLANGPVVGRLVPAGRGEQSCSGFLLTWLRAGVIPWSRLRTPSRFPFRSLCFRFLVPRTHPLLLALLRLVLLTCQETCLPTLMRRTWHGYVASCLLSGRKQPSSSTRIGWNQERRSNESWWFGRSRYPCPSVVPAFP